MQIAFIVGAPRSGTTWLQHMIGAHQEVATPQETEFFSTYIPQWKRFYERELDRSVNEWRQRRFKGLPTVLTSSQFDDLLLQTVDKAFAHVMRAKPTARILLEKNPNNSLHVPLLLDLFPTARFIHLIRDGRDVTSSLRRAGRGWGRAWAPSTAEDAAATWAAHVRGAMAAETRRDRYTTVRYEDLLDCGPSVLADLFRFLELPNDSPLCSAIYDRFSSARGDQGSIVWAGEALARPHRELAEPAGFFGEGRAGVWAKDLTPFEKLAVDRAAGTLLRELNYASDSWTGVNRVQRVAFAVRHWSLGRLLESYRRWRKVNRRAETSSR